MRIKDLLKFAQKFYVRSRLKAPESNSDVLTPDHPSFIRCRLCFFEWVPLSDKMPGDFLFRNSRHILEFGRCRSHFRLWGQAHAIDLCPSPVLPSALLFFSQRHPSLRQKLSMVPSTAWSYCQSSWPCSSQPLPHPHLMVCFLLSQSFPQTGFFRFSRLFFFFFLRLSRFQVCKTVFSLWFFRLRSCYLSPVAYRDTLHQYTII